MEGGCSTLFAFGASNFYLFIKRILQRQMHDLTLRTIFTPIAEEGKGKDQSSTLGNNLVPTCVTYQLTKEQVLGEKQLQMETNMA